jgi:hypothetical protein
MATKLMILRKDICAGKLLNAAEEPYNAAGDLLQEAHDRDPHRRHKFVIHSFRNTLGALSLYAPQAILRRVNPHRPSLFGQSSLKNSCSPPCWYLDKVCG